MERQGKEEEGGRMGCEGAAPPPSQQNFSNPARRIKQGNSQAVLY